MRASPSRLSITLLVLTSVVMVSPVLFGAPGDEHWDPRFTVPGADGRLDAFAEYGGHLYAGGRFTLIGSAVASRIARWDGTNWSPVGSGAAGSSPAVTALLVSGDKLIVGGTFTNMGGVATTNVAWWDGSQWHAMGQLGTGVSAGVNALGELNGEIYAGGSFTTGAAASYLARWNGASWQPVGDGVNNIVYAIERFGNALFIGGSFSQSGGLTARGLIRWDGTNFTAVGSGLSTGARVSALAARGSSLYVGGLFTQAGGITSANLALWDEGNSQWLAVGANGEVFELRAVSDVLYVGGRFTSVAGNAAVNLAALTAGSWMAFGSGIGSGAAQEVSAVLPFGGSVFAGGNFQAAGSVATPFIGRWDDTAAEWRAVGPTNLSGGLNNLAYAVAVTGTNVHAFGAFTLAGAEIVTSAARLTGNGWAAMAGGLPALTSGRYYSATDGSNIYVGGESAVQRWDGSAWTTLGSGAYGPVAWSGTNLYAAWTNSAGRFVARWSGTAWEPQGTNFVNTITPQPLILGLAADGDVLYATGYFQRVGTNEALNVAKWDGTQWIGMAGGVNPPGLSTSRTLALLDGDLLVGTARNGGTNNILRWNGAAWSTFPGLFTGSGAVTLEKILVLGNQLLVGGRFTHVDGIEVNRLAHWNGSQWRAFGSGVNNTVYDLAVADSNVYVAGLFTQAGFRSSARFAIWTGGLGGAALPGLSIANLGNSIRLSWSVDVTNSLESTLHFSPPDWKPFPGSPFTNGNLKMLEMTPTEESRYLRLK